MNVEHQLQKRLCPRHSACILQSSKSLYDVGVCLHTKGLSGILGEKDQLLCL